QFGYERGKVDLYGIFHAVRPPAYPHVLRRFCVFSQLVGGLGEIPFFVDVTYPKRARLVRTTQTNVLNFANRQQVVQLATSIENCLFPEPGLYLVELYCDNVCIADVSLS